MRLSRIQEYMTRRGMQYSYREEDDCGTIEFDHRGLHYHIWEYPAPERGAQSNVRSAGKSEDFDGNYEEQLLEILETWWR